MDLLNRYRGCLLGLAAGDAVGTTVEFRQRGSFETVADMTGGGPFHLQPGQWTDDTSMALCLASSLVERQGFDPYDQMERYLRWYEHGYWSSTGRCFDIGNTTRGALLHYKQTGDPFSGSTDPHAAGNGSLMRLAPAPLYFYPDREQAIHFAAECSRTTHAAPECLDACRLFADLLVRALSGAEKAAILFEADLSYLGSPKIYAIGQGEYRAKTGDQINGSGYVVQSLEAALWCFWTTSSFEQAILAAANLGDDADTTAAICGQIAGAFYGESGIPASWLQKLAMADQIRGLADGLRREKE
jgi:ADP-ribosyl-[dinitrogen reductase] hydrolase